MEYGETIRWLFGLQRFGIKLGLDNIRAILAEMGDPQERRVAVLVGGTNGKGSTAAFVAALGRAHGLRSGLYTSPHLQKFNERIQVDGEPITDDEVVRQTREIKAAIDSLNARRDAGEQIRITFFEFTTVMAIRHFLAAGCDLDVYEVGMGGRLDATNAVPAAVSVVTHVGLEHQVHLGDTIAKIAYEKAGIIKPGRPTVTAETDPEALAVFRSAAIERGAELLEMGTNFDAREGSDGTFDYRGFYADVRGLISGIPGGAVQVKNAACALAAWEQLSRTSGWRLDPDAARRAIADARLPGRLEWVRRDPPVLLDVSHNPDAAQTLVAFAEREILPGGRKPVALVGLMQDKDARGYLAAVRKIAGELIVTRSVVPDARDPGELAGLAKELGFAVTVAPTVAEGMAELATRLAEPARIGLIVGSFYVVGEVLDHLDANPGWPSAPAPGIGRVA